MPLAIVTALSAFACLSAVPFNVTTWSLVSTSIFNALTSGSAITGKVKTALIADPDVKALKIDVDTKDHVVTLNGTADKQANADKAVTIAQGIEGVKSVENRLTIKP